MLWLLLARPGWVATCVTIKLLLYIIILIVTVACSCNNICMHRCYVSYSKGKWKCHKECEAASEGIDQFLGQN